MILKHLLTTSLSCLYKRKNNPAGQNQNGILELKDDVVTKILFGDKILSASSNTLILNSTTDSAIPTIRFDDSILTHGQ